MAKQPSEPMLLLPYSEVMELLDAAREIKNLVKQIKRLEQQQAALRGQFFELIERLRELD